VFPVPPPVTITGFVRARGTNAPVTDATITLLVVGPESNRCYACCLILAPMTIEVGDDGAFVANASFASDRVEMDIEAPGCIPLLQVAALGELAGNTPDEGLSIYLTCEE